MELVERGSSMDGIERSGGDGSSTEGAEEMSPQYPQIHAREQVQCVDGFVGRCHLQSVRCMSEEQSLQLSSQMSVNLTTRQILQATEMAAFLAP